MLFAVTMGIYTVMVVWSLPLITSAAGGLAPFDMRPTGYSETEGRLLLAALDGETRAFYLGTQQRLDLIYPVLLALTLSFAIWHLFRGMPAYLRAVMVVFPILGAAFDYLENARVAVLLRLAEPGVSAGQIAAASQATLFKSGFTIVAMILVVGGLVGAILKRWKFRG